MFPRIFNRHQDEKAIEGIEALIDNEVATTLDLGDNYIVFVEVQWMDAISEELMRAPVKLKNSNQHLDLNTLLKYSESPFDRTPITEVTYLEDNRNRMQDFFKKVLLAFEKAHPNLKDDSSEKVIVNKIKKFLEFPDANAIKEIIAQCKAKGITIKEMAALEKHAGIQKADAKIVIEPHDEKDVKSADAKSAAVSAVNAEQEPSKKKIMPPVAAADPNVSKNKAGQNRNQIAADSEKEFHVASAVKVAATTFFQPDQKRAKELTPALKWYIDKQEYQNGVRLNEQGAYFEILTKEKNDCWNELSNYYSGDTSKVMGDPRYQVLDQKTRDLQRTLDKEGSAIEIAKVRKELENNLLSDTVSPSLLQVIEEQYLKYLENPFPLSQHDFNNKKQG